MDVHHRKFFEYLAELDDAAGGNRSREVVERGLKLAEDYIKFHFSEEERLLETTGFPGLARQLREHQFFAAQIEELREKYSEGDEYLPISALAFLKDWFMHHILEEDKQYGEYLAGTSG